jgi:hypothetical protein
VANGAAKPLWAGQPPGDTSRLFVIEQQTADIEIYHLPSGVKNATPFLDLTSKVNGGSNERGLLGMAFDSDYANTGFFWVYYTQSAVPNGALVIERYTVPDQVATPTTPTRSAASSSWARSRTRSRTTTAATSSSARTTSSGSAPATAVTPTTPA